RHDPTLCLPLGPSPARSLAREHARLRSLDPHARLALAALLDDGLHRARRPALSRRLRLTLLHDPLGTAATDPRAAPLRVRTLADALRDTPDDSATRSLLTSAGAIERQALQHVLHIDLLDAASSADPSAALRSLRALDRLGEAPPASRPWLLAMARTRPDDPARDRLLAAALAADPRHRTAALRILLRQLRRADRDPEALAVAARLERLARDPAARLEALEACVVLALRIATPTRAEGCLLAFEDTARLPEGDLLLRSTRRERGTLDWRLDLALHLLRSGDPLAALQRLRELSREDTASPFQRARAAWWHAMVAEQNAAPQEARLALERALAAAPLSLYGRLAARRTGGIDPLPELLHAAPAFRPHGVEEPLLTLAASGHLGEAASQASFLVHDLGLDLPAAQAILALHLAATGADILATRLEQVHVRLAERDARELPAFAGAVFLALHPRPWAPALAAAAHESGIAPPVLRAIMRRESAFREGLVSPVGARGLMQVQPATAALVLGPRPPRGAWRQALLDPEQGTRAGAATLAWLSHRKQGCAVRTAAAYSTGHGRVARWTAAAGIDDAMLWLEWVPYPGVRHYVRDVVTTAERYAALQGGAAFPLLTWEVSAGATP
ncbi:MAG: hypothetical protein EA398_13440, partial [Deltaproteobacteria bacterium]